jgi:outer membrane lipoprotein carrier protein
MKSAIKKMSILILALTTGLSTFSQNANEILEELSSNTDSFENIKVTFVYKMENKEADISEETNGVLLLEGDKYNLNIAGQVVISNGETLWTYLPDSEEVQINEVYDDDGFSPSKLLSSYTDDYKAKKMNDIKSGGRMFYHLELKPIDKDSNFDFVELVIDKEKMQLSKFIIHDFEENIFTYSINQFITNSELSDDSFFFDTEMHPNVEIIDMR